MPAILKTLDDWINACVPADIIGGIRGKDPDDLRETIIGLIESKIPTAGVNPECEAHRNVSLAADE